jgi:FtsH-binding integral membrane protein
MADNFGNQIFPRGTTRTIDQAAYDVGLRKHMLSVYNYMASGLALSGIVALVLFNSPSVASLFYAATPQGIAFTMLGYIVMFAPLVMTFGIGAVMRGSVTGAQIFYWVFVTLMGISLSTLLFRYTGTSVARIFFITAAAFAGLSLYGYTTKRDLSGFGKFLIMGAIGIMIALVVNIFLGSTMLLMVASILGVLIFAGLTAYDTQAIKEQYNEAYDEGARSKMAIFGALLLYLNFINMFQFLLILFGNNRN